MNGMMMLISILIVLVSIIMIASNAFGVECYNVNEDYKKDHEKKFRFTLFSLVVAIIGLIIGSIATFKSFKAE